MDIEVKEVKNEVKTLANCKPSEFLRQTNRIRKAVEKWLTDTDIANIRKRQPLVALVPENATAEERIRIVAENEKNRNEQVKKNLSAIFDAILEEHPDETLEVLALCCFIDPANVDDYPITYYLNAAADLMNDEAVISFFTSLLRWAQTSTSTVSKT
jgi:hypothetical protein